MIEENLNIYSTAFSFPPRVGRTGLIGVLGTDAATERRLKGDYELKRFLDESLLDELEREGFYKKVAASKDGRK